MRKISALCAAIAALCASAAAATGSPSLGTSEPLSFRDFSSYHFLDAKEVGRVYRFHITGDIFRRLRQSYEVDLAVFDSDGNVVPFIVRDAKMSYQANTATTEVTVPLFPLPPTGDFPASMMDVTVKTGADGQVIEIRGSGPETRGGGRFLADLSKAGAVPEGYSISGYRIEIPAGGKEDAAAYVDVRASDNLRDWRQVARREPLIHLRRGDDILTSSVIELDHSGPARYLMLEMEGEWELPDSVAISITAVENETGFQPDSEAFEGQPDEPLSVVYDTSGAFPASRINFMLKNPGIYAASVSSRKETGSEWRRHAEMRLSLINSGEGESRNAAMGVHRTNDRFWRLTARDKLPFPSPTMIIYWHPKELVFVAQGKPPYRLAFGSDKDSPWAARPDLMNIALADIAERAIPEARIDETMVPASAAQTGILNQDSEAAGKQWAKYAMWASLSGGALLLSWIAWRLIRKDKSAR
jgi:hypothetical protein